MENVKSLMQSLDSISGMIPEGTYLEMANNLKEVHTQIPHDEDPPVTDQRSLRIDIPFMPRSPNSLGDESEEHPETYDPFEMRDDPYDERYFPFSSEIPNLDENFRNPREGFFVCFDRNRDENGNVISRPVERCLIRQDIIAIGIHHKKCIKRMRELKPIKNITTRVKEDAIKSYVNAQLLNLQTFTFECMCRTYPQLFAYDMRVRMFTRRGELTRFGKEVERDIYMEYIETRNTLTDLKSLDAHTEYNWLMHAKRISLDRIMELTGR